jgi:hypothetical protein
LLSEKSFEERLEATLDAKRALFAAAVGDDVETVEMARSSLASRIATLMGGSFAATTGRGPEEAQPADELSLLRARLGASLERVVRLPNGRLLGVVRGDVAPAVESPVLLLPASAADALLPLGDASPLAHAEIVYKADPKTPLDEAKGRRLARVDAAMRKLKAGRTLVEAGSLVEALHLFREALSLGCRAACERGDPGEDAAALFSAIYGELLPGGAITAADAHALSRAGELARAFESTPALLGPEVVAEIERDARDLLARIRERLGTPGEVTAA